MNYDKNYEKLILQRQKEKNMKIDVIPKLF